MVDETLLLDRHRDRVELHLLVVYGGPFDPVYSQEIVGSLVSTSSRIARSLATSFDTFSLVPDYVQEIVVVLGRGLPSSVRKMLLEVIYKVTFSLLHARVSVVIRAADSTIVVLASGLACAIADVVRAGHRHVGVVVHVGALAADSIRCELVSVTRYSDPRSLSIFI
jgi:hypothetical protein